jgi:crotonobetainyl-CoA:carnitine CoA-transferase CaiB-like acyl-CoA transferase
MQPLSGLLVLDFTTLLPGPLAALMLAEAGAEVIKIERPGGEDMRRFPPIVDGESAVFAMLNRGKQVLTLDLKSDTDREKLKPLIARADILIEQFRPGVMARLGLGYDDLKAINPKLIYCAISGYGQSGPRANEAGHDLNYIGNTGLLDLQPGPSDAPVVPPALIADIAGGSFPAVINILLALRARDQSGQGAFIDIAMTDAMFTFAWYALALGSASGRFPNPASCRSWEARRATSFIRPRTEGSSPAGRSSRSSGSVLPRRLACRWNLSMTGAIRWRPVRQWQS